MEAVKKQKKSGVVRHSCSPSYRDGGGLRPSKQKYKTI
jgi:hypothetical protein